MKIVSLALAAAMSFSAPAVHALTTLGFDDITTAFTAPVPQGYGGVAWLGFSAIDGNRAVGQGLFDSIISPTYVALGDGAAGGVGPFGSAFGGKLINLKDAYFGSAFADGATLTVTGLGKYRDYTTSFTIDTFGPTFQTFNWNDVGIVAFSVTGGTLDANSPAGAPLTLFAMDNLRFSAAPEAATWAMMITGFGIVGAVSRRRRFAAV